MTLLRAELAMTKSDLDAARREVESAQGARDPQDGDGGSLRQENEALRAEMAAVKKNAAAAVTQMAEAFRAQLSVVEAETLRALAM